MSPEEKKDLHIKQAAEYIYYLEEAKEKIYDKEDLLGLFHLKAVRECQPAVAHI